MAGLPERVLPFTKGSESYKATIDSTGHPRVTKLAVVVVTGERFISAAEVIPMPEGRPILILHDPPGGQSFVTFDNVRAESVYYETRSSDGDGFSEAVAVGGNVDLEFKVAEVAQVPGGPGLVLETPPVLNFDVTGVYGQEYSWSDEKSTSRGSDNAQWPSGYSMPEKKGSSTWHFTYQTSADPWLAGPASTAFLMPALTFQVTEVWVVTATVTADQDGPLVCKTRGREDKTLTPKEDLSAFYFTQAIDVETRVLPTLKDAAADIQHKIDCDAGKECCTNDDMLYGGCDPDKVNTLEMYCDFLSPDHNSASYKTCIKFSENHWKTNCVAYAERIKKASAPHYHTSLTCTRDCDRDCPPEYDLVHKSYDRCGFASVVPGSSPADGLDLDSVEDRASSFNKDTNKDEVMAFAPTITDDSTASGSVQLCRAFCVQKPTPRTREPHNSHCSTNPTANGWTSTSEKIFAADLSEWCDEYAHQYTEQHHGSFASQRAECMKFDDTGALGNAYDAWFRTLRRAALKQEKALRPGKTLFYEDIIVMDAVQAAHYQNDEVTLKPIKDLAPHILIDHAMNLDGSDHSKAKKIEYKAYNTVSFDGGGSSIEYEWSTSKVRNGKDFTGYNREQTVDREHTEDRSHGPSLDYKAGGLGISWRILADLQWEEVAVRVATTTSTESDGSTISFHFEDAQVGDYFLVTIWEDPEYPSPIFGLAGGASSCKWEAGTYHRTAPTLEVSNIGPLSVPPGQPALFKITMASGVNYYQGGPGSTVGRSAQLRGRPGWSTVEISGYALPTMALAVKGATVPSGLVLTMNGASPNTLLHNFPKGMVEKIIEAYRGPSALGEYQLPGPELVFGEYCGEPLESGTGEVSAAATLGNFGAPGQRTIAFAPPCPRLVWSGDILSQSTFSIAGSNPKPVHFTVRNPSGMKWKESNPKFQELEFQYRSASHSAWVPSAEIVTDVNSREMDDKDATFYKGTFGVKDIATETGDGEYDIRVIAKCEGTNGGQDPLELVESSTSVIRGIVSREQSSVAGTAKVLLDMQRELKQVKEFVTHNSAPEAHENAAAKMNEEAKKHAAASASATAQRDLEARNAERLKEEYDAAKAAEAAAHAKGADASQEKPGQRRARDEETNVSNETLVNLAIASLMADDTSEIGQALREATAKERDAAQKYQASLVLIDSLDAKISHHDKLLRHAQAEHAAHLEAATAKRAASRNAENETTGLIATSSDPGSTHEATDTSLQVAVVALVVVVALMAISNLLLVCKSSRRPGHVAPAPGDGNLASASSQGHEQFQSAALGLEKSASRKNGSMKKLSTQHSPPTNPTPLPPIPTAL
jgi:hypothetical protein